MTKVLISTVFGKPLSTKLSVIEFNIQKIFLLVDRKSKDIEAGKKQLDSITTIKKAFEDTIDILEEKVDLYDIVSISKSLNKIINKIPKEDTIYIDISQGTKLQAIGTLLSCYSKSARIEKIIYWNDERQKIILPKFSINLSNEERNLLMNIEKNHTAIDLLRKKKYKKTTIYRLLKELEKKQLLEKKEGKYFLTDAGNLAIL